MIGEDVLCFRTNSGEARKLGTRPVAIENTTICVKNARSEEILSSGCIGIFVDEKMEV